MQRNRGKQQNRKAQRSLQENWKYQGNISYKTGHHKGRNCKDLTEAEDIKKRWQEYTEELYKKDLHDPNNHDGVITHLETDILEYELRWASGSINMNKASGGDGILAVLFQILKDDAVKVLHSICQQIQKIQQWPQDWKRSVFIPIPRKACQRMFKLPYNCTYFTCQQGNAQNPSSQASAACELRTSSNV